MNNRSIKLMLLDALASSITLYIAFLVRFDFILPENYLATYFSWMPWFPIFQVLPLIVVSLHILPLHYLDSLVNGFYTDELQ